MKLHLRENVLGQVQFCTQGRFLGPWAERHYKSSMQEIVDEHERQAAEIERLRRALDLLTAAADLNGAVAAIAEIADAEGFLPSDVIPVWPNRTKQDREDFYGSGSDYPQVEIGHVKALQAALHSAREALKSGEVE